MATNRKVTKLTVARLKGSERDVYAEWTCKNDSHLKEFEYFWSYFNGQRWFYSDKGTTNSGETANRRMTWSPPGNAIQISLKIKAVSKEKSKVKKGESKVYFKDNWTILSSPFKIGIVIPESKGPIKSIKFEPIGVSSPRTVRAYWKWSKAYTSGFEIAWQYVLPERPTVWLSGTTGTVPYEGSNKEYYSTYDVPDTAYAVRIKIKPVAQASMWFVEETESGQFLAVNLPLSKPSAPSVSLDKFKLTATVKYTNNNASSIEFQLIKNDSETGATIRTAALSTQTATTDFTLAAGSPYKVRCRASNGNSKSDWSDYSETIYAGPAPPKITSAKLRERGKIELKWDSNDYPDSFTIQWTTNKDYFDHSSEVQEQSGITEKSFIVSVGADGNTFFFRVKAVKGSANSAWSNIVSLTSGKRPAPPTTWSLVTVATVGDQVKLYWNHNSQDNSSQTMAILSITVNDTTLPDIPVPNNRSDEDKDKISEYIYDTSSLTEGAKIKWKVKTKGAYNGENGDDPYSDWSITRTIDIYAPPSIFFIYAEQAGWFWSPFNFVTDSIYSAKGIGTDYTNLESLPIRVYAKSEPDSQRALRFVLTVTSLSSYESEDSNGELIWISEGDKVFEKIFYPSEEDNEGPLRNCLLYAISADEITLENGCDYRLTCSVSMNSGLLAECSKEFTVMWADDTLEPNAEFYIDEETYSARIVPYCEGDDGEWESDVLLSVYRRNYDGSFTELGRDIFGYLHTTIVDPHPALDYLRYRIVAKSLHTGQISYYDSPNVEYGETGIIIQWDENWSDFSVNDEDAEPVERPWTGSLIRLPYNIDVTEQNDLDVEMVEYIGREHPVSYYGTQKGENATWNVDIDAEDKETIYALRRLKNYMGNAYVREPYGTGYWANISVSFSKKHTEVVIPVTLTVTRVEGGA